MEEKRLNIGLYGISGLYNFGTEAILIGTTNLIKKLRPNANITYYSRNFEEDKIITNRLNINIKSISIKPNLLYRTINFFLSKLNIHKRITFDKVSEIISGSDIIFSIGGDIYTVPQEILNNKTKIAYSRLVQVGEKIINNNVPIIIYGASIGPFGSNLKNIEYFRKHLEKASLIVCREFKTINYLKSLGLDRSLEFMPDPAYYVKTDKAKNVPKKRIIAFNISEFSIKEHINDIDEYIEQLIYELYRIASDKDYTILFVPHVVPSKNTVDNDLAFLLKIFSKIPIHMKNRFDIIDKKLGFIETKKILKQCDVLVASRMHCAINAISENIPTILLSYSEKSIGMAEFIYNNTNWVIPMNDLNERIYNTISNLLLNKDGAEKDIRRRLNEIYESPLYKQVEEKIADLFREISNE